jgi:threonine/homoserine/homoserine lactone efflux protein
MISFVAAICLLLITPGPGVLSVAGVGSAFGYRSGFRYMAGLFVGTNLVALCVVTGLAAILLAEPIVRTILLWASVTYLLYLAVRIAFSGRKISFSPALKRPGIVDGIALQMLNPKAYVVNTTLFTGFPLFPSAFGAEIATKFLIVNTIWILVHISWLWAGVALHRLNLAPQIQFAINILMALAMLAVVALAAWRTF